jgi:hypothetical protein
MGKPAQGVKNASVRRRTDFVENQTRAPADTGLTTQQIGRDCRPRWRPSVPDPLDCRGRDPARHGVLR